MPAIVHLPEKRNINFTVPLVPPSVNHYVKHTRMGKHYMTGEAKAFKNAVELFGNQAVRKILEESVDATISSGAYGVVVTVFLGAGQRGDVDNFAKVVLDGLKPFVGSDDKIIDLHIYKRRDRSNPRTEITVKAL
jgi:Holliday junction resolvase RusA-like endonuclease